MTATDLGTRKRLLINRHIAKMTPEEIARRFTVAYTAPLAANGAKKGKRHKVGLEEPDVWQHT